MRPRHMRGGLLLFAVPLALAACGDVPAHTASPVVEEELIGSWELVEGRAEGGLIPEPDGGRATLVVEYDTLGGTAFCNSYRAEYRLRHGALSLDGLGMTEMGCTPELMEAEDAYLSALGAADERVALEGGHLMITGDGVELRFRPLPLVPASDVVDTRWVLETVLRGDIANSTSGEPAVLTLSDEGTFQGSTGCRDLSGTWVIHGDEIVFPTMRADGDCPPGLLEQDDHVIGVLGDGFQTDVKGDELTITDADGSGLIYRVERP